MCDLLGLLGPCLLIVLPYGGLSMLGEPLQPYDSLYADAVEAYHRGDWKAVVLGMEAALGSRSRLMAAKRRCAAQCSGPSTFSAIVGATERSTLFDLKFFKEILRTAACVQTCENEHLGDSSYHVVSEEMELEFQRRTPYNYLQLAYFKLDKLERAAAAAHTFFVANPEHSEMAQNLEYYRSIYAVPEESFVDLEAQPHMDAFRQGRNHYSLEEFDQAAEYVELALTEYFEADEACRALCHGMFNHDGYSYLDYTSDLYQTLADHYVQVLMCKQGCSKELATRPGQSDTLEDYLPSHYHYLQYSFYRLDDLEAAVACARAFLLFYPNDEVMQQNLHYYLMALGDHKEVTPRQEAKRYFERSLIEKELLFFASESFGTEFVDPDSWTPDSIKPESLRQRQQVQRSTTSRISEEIGNLMKEIEDMVEAKTRESDNFAAQVTEGGPLIMDGVTLTQESAQLNGSGRVLMDNVISNEECTRLFDLVKIAGLAGDGYGGKPSPHSPSERFDGITVYRALRYAQEGRVPLPLAKLFYDVSEKARQIIHSYFRLKSPLFFSFSHLVCRTALDGKQGDRMDLSHPVHADNCVLNTEFEECRKEPPAYTYRDYSAILYLNDNFDGGKFIFTTLNEMITAEVQPKCGRMVGFSSGSENPHGVRAVTKGQRCAVALWFTLDPIHKERERLKADDIVSMLFSDDVDETKTATSTARDEL
uniref:prolyl 3-hydroxylase 1-like n=1 Tax=Myxine glutinosa TaxID=7769 RepID=UPI0035901F86